MTEHRQNTYTSLETEITRKGVGHVLSRARIMNVVTDIMNRERVSIFYLPRPHIGLAYGTLEVFTRIRDPLSLDHGRFQGKAVAMALRHSNEHFPA